MNDLSVTTASGGELAKNNVTDYDALQRQLADASLLVDDIVLKKYLTKLTELKIIPVKDKKSLEDISDIRLFRISEMVYQKDEYSTYKFASVFNSVQHLHCGVFIIADSNGQKTDFYMGVRSLDNERTASSLIKTLRNALCGQFPGVKVVNVDNRPHANKLKDFLDGIGREVKGEGEISYHNIASVSCVAENKDESFNNNERFIQGLEKFALAMQGQRYTTVILAKSTPAEQLAVTRRAYEAIYTQLSPLATTQISYGSNSALSVSDAFSYGKSFGSTYTTNITDTTGTSTTSNESVSQDNALSRVMGAIGAIGGAAAIAVSGAAAIASGGAAIPLSAPVIALGATAAGTGMVAAFTKKTITTGTSETENTSHSVSLSNAESETTSENYTYTKGLTSGITDNMQLTVQNKSLLNTLERIDLQLKRIDECESLGMWECAAYFLSNSQETTAMAAGTYKALMKGEKSGVETSAINFWDSYDKKGAMELPLLREYIANFIHPVFEYSSAGISIPVTASSLVSGNELAIQMGLPRKSVCGFPVIERADFGKEAVRYDGEKAEPNFVLGSIYSMGNTTKTEVRLNRDSLAMHTFITGSTGSGKSNTVYEILKQLKNVYRIPFLVVEPAKGEYKNVFGQFPDVFVYGSNPYKTKLLKINPFRFPAGIHVLEHLDRLVELFNVCWPMYAAMPAILKDAMEKAYEEEGWDLAASKNDKGQRFPNFKDLLEQIKNVIKGSEYSADSKSDYSGALCTRVKSLTNGLNRLIFCDDDLQDADLFDKNVIVDLSRIGSIETKSLMMGLLVLRLNEYRSVTSKEGNRSLQHITVLEEAHNLLKRTSTEQSSESANLLGKSVELLTNSIAEMRTYGEGFLIVDQSPGLLDMSAIRNTNTKIIMRLPDQSDRELVGLSAGLNREQLDELSKLQRGVAAVYQNDWIEPVLVKMEKSRISEKAYTSVGDSSVIDIHDIKRQIIFMLIQGRVRERLDFDVSEIERHMGALGLSSRNREFIEVQIAEILDEGSLSVWQDESFRKLSRQIVDIMDVRSRVESYAANMQPKELTEKLSQLIRQMKINTSDAVEIALCQCLMKDLSVGQDEAEVRQRIYKQWHDYIVEGEAIR